MKVAIIVLFILFCIGILIVFHAMIGYPIFIYLLGKLKKAKLLQKDFQVESTVTYMIVAHNEEKVILEKLENALMIDYPNEKIEILVASDNSTDRTNAIVEKFIAEHPEKNIRLYSTKEHKGKTNAQNEAQKTVKNQIIVFTDANSILNSDAIKELVSCFTDDSIAYVCGKLLYKNDGDSNTSNSESTYWKMDLKMREIESRIQTITAGNGAIYACRNKDYVDFAPIECHDSAMPLYYAKKKKRAIYNPDAIAVEKAGEVNSDEFKRKVRMNRGLLSGFFDGLITLNIFKYKWFSIFYFGHRTCRYLLWFAHLIAIIGSIGLTLFGILDNILGFFSIFGIVTTALQIIAVILTLTQLKKSAKNKLIRMIGYYGMTVLAQYIGIFNILTGRAKPTWEKAESTR